ncbi:MAG: hypothetical protein EB084_25250, partial [Proteobacteria bacterium]|nr:hypothetical protein [Pseudomonadota bacterium]
STVNRPIYFYVDHPTDGPFTLGATITASFSAGVSAFVVDPHAATGAEFPMSGTPTVSSSSTYNRTDTHTQTFTLPRGRYVLRVELDTSGGTYSASVTAH